MPYASAMALYVAPAWARAVPALAARAPAHRLTGLANFPTPVLRWELPERLVPGGFRLWIKRDDVTGSELSGNKVRKLQFLLADALAKGADCVVTIGGEQSNHARASALAARAVGLEPHCVLRSDHSPETLGLAGNLLMMRLAGAKLHLASKRAWREKGTDRLLDEVVGSLRSQGRRPYLIALGGSNGLGTWGYLEAVEELKGQMGRGGAPAFFSDIALATGSGGTSGGVALGVHLAALGARVHGFSVCNSPDYFYRHIDERIVGEMLGGGDPSSLPTARELLQVRDVQGRGYARSTPEELDLIRDISTSSGVILDPVYSGKGVGGLLALMRSEPEAFQGRDVLFWHTGGLLGVFDKADEIRPLLNPADVRAVQEE